MIETRERGSDPVALSHFEVLPEVLIAAPPVGPDHVKSFVSADLMEVGVADIVFLSVDGEAAVSVRLTMCLVGFAETVAPMLDHAFLLYKLTREETYCS